MGWNWSAKRASKLVRRKPSVEGDGTETPAEVKALAERYIRRGLTRQRAYARARKELNAPVHRKPKKPYRGGGVSPR